MELTTTIEISTTVLVYRPLLMQTRNSLFYTNVIDDKNGMFPNDTFIIVDSAYPASDWLVTPFKDNGQMSKLQRSLNLILSSTRMVVENSFALLKNRFKRLYHFTEQIKITLIVNLIVSACVIHNICIIKDDPYDCGEPDLINPVVLRENEGFCRRQTLIDEHIENNVLNAN